MQFVPIIINRTPRVIEVVENRDDQLAKAILESLENATRHNDLASMDM